MENIKGIIFDYGGTIDSRGEHWWHVIRRSWEQAGLAVDVEQFRQAYVETERAFAREPLIGPQDTFLTLMQKKMAVEIAFLVGKGVLPPERASLGEAIAHCCYESARRSVNEARPVLEELKKHFPMVLVSNFYGNVEAVLEDFDLRKYFDTVVESAVVGVRKPDPAIFALGVEALGLPAEQVLVVGDSYRKDILPARSLGCQTAWIKGPGWTAEEDAVEDDCQIDGLTDLLKICADA